METRYWIVAAALLLMSWTTPASADALRCGSRLVSEGDTPAAVRARCGEPGEISRGARLRAPVIWRHGRPIRVGDHAIEVQTEAWVYNLGPSRFMRRIRFEDDRVVSIETLGYGYRKEHSRPDSKD
jgi:Protein of unknown function (DUF2845)